MECPIMYMLSGWLSPNTDCRWQAPVSVNCELQHTTRPSQIYHRIKQAESLTLSQAAQ